MTVIHQIAATIAAHPDRPVDMLSAVVSIAARAMEADLCAFLLFDEQTKELATQPGAYGVAGDAESLYRISVTNRKSSSVRVFLTGEPFMTGDAPGDPRMVAHLVRRWGCRSIIVVPLTLEGRRIGVMRVGSRKRDFFSRDHLAPAGLIADEAVVLIESAILTRKLSEANRRLSEIGKLKDDFVSTVSHEFKTPLTSITGFLTVLLDGDTGILTEEQTRFLSIAKSAADRLTALVSDLLDLAKLESGARMDFEAVPLAKLIERCRQDYEHQARERGIDLSGLRPAGTVEGDPKWLRQLLDNLVSNALKFTPSGGSVTLSAARKGEMALVTVADTGVGIGPEDRERIFERFYRASGRGDANVPGTGLGLAIAKYIVDEHEGSIWVESEPGKGSRFHVALPTARTRVAKERKTRRTQ